MDDPEHNYRAYLVSTDGHIVFRVDLDETAKGKAKALVDGHIELWDGARILDDLFSAHRHLAGVRPS
jgi:hypothetical protein